MCVGVCVRDVGVDVCFDGGERESGVSLWVWYVCFWRYVFVRVCMGVCVCICVSEWVGMYGCE